MDPNETLRLIRENFARWAAGTDGARSNPEDFADMQYDLFSALDEWLSGGGFLPDEWRNS